MYVHVHGLRLEIKKNMKTPIQKIKSKQITGKELISLKFELQVKHTKKNLD